MLQHPEIRTALTDFFQSIIPKNLNHKSHQDKVAKLDQVLAYLEVMHAHLRKYSKKRDLVLIDTGAGNCYLSFLVYHFYTQLDPRNITIHCLDTNARLMEKAQQLACTLNFDNMHFHACDIANYMHPGHVDVVYALHACDAATDKALYLGLRNRAKWIFSVACCQHKVKSHLRSHPYTGITKHRIFKDKVAYMVGDCLRALLLEMQGYEVDIFEFVSSRATDKNIMLRAHVSNQKNLEKLQQEYIKLRDAFHVTPLLETYLHRDTQ